MAGICHLLNDTSLGAAGENLAERAEHQATFQDLAEQLKEYQKRTRDRCFTMHTYE